MALVFALLVGFFFVAALIFTIRYQSSPHPHALLRRSAEQVSWWLAILPSL